VSEAQRTAGKEIFIYVRELELHAHWATLRAAVRRGGTFFGARHIDLPRDFALRFEEPIADVWGRSVLKEIRARTKSFAQDCIELVTDVADWAHNQGARVQPRLVDAQGEAIKADMMQLEAVGRDMVDELRETVKNTLIEAIEAPIRKKCRQFVERNEHLGTGTKWRILNLFRELAEEVTETASGPANRILKDCFRSVEQEIQSTLKNHQDPLRTVTETIVEAHELHVKRSDAQKRKRVLDDVRRLLGTTPCRTAVVP